MACECKKKKNRSLQMLSRNVMVVLYVCFVFI
uniref:Uncharacterized protein n=1 Tax=Anguilla anguilla TaxID=7936 RepID=A0A0E9WWR1_ANGAN